MTQTSLFEAPAEPPPEVDMREHASPSYVPRTKENARSGDVTLAVAIDYDSAGERLTKTSAGDGYIAIPYGTAVTEALPGLVRFLRHRRARVINVAGNGIYTFSQKSITQDQVNLYLYQLLKEATAAHSVERIRSGGQTGADWAGLVAGIALGIPATGLFPKGFRQRNASKQEFYKSHEDVLRWLAASVARLHHSTTVNEHPT
jgi:hypothetical protein